MMRRESVGLMVFVLAFIVATGGVLGGVGRAAAQDATPAAMTTIAITVTATEFAFEAPSEVAAGLVTVTLANEGEFRHHVQLFKVNEGTTSDEFIAGLETGAAFGLGVASGGPSTVPGGGTSSAILRLGAGDYVALCFVTGRDGVPHFAKGMTAVFTVAGEDAGEPDPTADAEVTLADYEIGLGGDSFTAGQHIWKVTNNGEDNHELAILKLPDGMTADDYTAGIMAAANATPTAAPAATPGATPLAGPPQPTAVGGMKALGTDLTGWAVLDLEPGEYVAVCFIPEEDGTSHAVLGMIAGFTVT